MTAVRAQETGVDEIVVTGSRITRGGYDDEGDSNQPPYVQVVRRADNLIVTVRVVCDTRDDGQRLSELRQTLANMGRAAHQNTAIELGVGGEVVGRFDPHGLDSLIVPDGGRAQVSVAVLVVKTPISADDTFDKATGRLKAFIQSVQAVGRTEVLPYGDWQLTIKGPERYRPDILAAMSADARTTADAFGPGYAVRVEGLQRPVTWLKAGPLDLALFIPYSLSVTPRPG
jgi:hypothetical protein